MPIHFTCPHCGATSDVDDQYIGQTLSCVRCKKTVTMPGTPLRCGAAPPNPRPRHRFTLVELLVVIAVIGILTALLLPARSESRETIRRRACIRNLTQIGQAMLKYHEKYGCFPPAFIPDENGKPKHSWRVLLLPFMEQGKLYAEYRFDEPWNSPHNIMLGAKRPYEYRCPSHPMHDSTLPTPEITSYAMVVGPHAISDGPAARRKADISDGLDKTIMVVEVVGADINWLEPRDLDVSKMTFHIAQTGDKLASTATDISSGHTGMARVLMCDGTVRSLRDDIDPKLLEAMTTIDGGETVDLNELSR
jgi:prepilin-type N-terminal cleavage/methylation domain-containing protein